jgi:uroporphyrinogen-III synthase
VSLPLIILRPEPGASQSLARALEMGLTARKCPLFKMEPMPWAVPDGSSFDALVMTSANALRLGGDALLSLQVLPVIAVGSATAAAARATGFEVVYEGDGDGNEAALAAAALGFERLLHIAGKEHRGLGQTGASIKTVIAYASIPLATPAMLLPLIAQPCVAMVHSARAAERLNHLAGSRQAHITLVAISKSVVRAAGEGWQRTFASSLPSDAAMLALARDLCDEAS